METAEIIKEIVNYFENTILFRPNLTSYGLQPPTVLKKQLHLDIVNTKPKDQNDSKIYPLENIEQVYEILSGIYQKPVSETKGFVDDFVRRQKVELAHPLYLVAYMLEAK